ncbi:hypothetical protein SEA_EASTWEST_80 [Arthrobacter phage EastWest]|uniref:Uncharacterized protein n=1 Tax=Arthrobacter phage EastWest TaxID=2894292 RepID=A0AAE8YKC2_9CAUD|nr:hypothetical protein SEA_EASTWEST_80 [Arthrobacter phage EastWest]
MTKANQNKIERVIGKLKRHDYMTEFSGMEFRTEQTGWQIEIEAKRDDETLVKTSFSADTPVSEIVEIIIELVAAKKREIAEREAAEKEFARNRPATPAEKRAFENLLQRVDMAVKHYAKAAASMRTYIDEGKQISSHVFEELMQAEAERKVMLWLNNCLMRDCSIVATLEDVVDLCDRETSFYNGHNSTSVVNNALNEREHVHFLKMGRIARLRSEY